MLQTLLAEGRPLLADGATGTNLFAMGLASGESPELWNATHPDRIRALHQAFVDAGSDIILTNSFGGNRRRLALHGPRRATRELNRLAAENARAVADAAGPAGRRRRIGRADRRPARPARPADRGRGGRRLRRADRGPEAGRRGRRLDRDHVGAEEIRAAAARRGEGRHALTVTGELRHRRADDDGRRAGRVRRAGRRLRAKPLAYGANCGVGASDLLVSILAMSEADPDAVVIAKANAGVPHWHGARDPLFRHAGADGGLRRPRGRLRRAHRRRLLRQPPAHVAAMRRGLDAHEAGPRPDLEAIVAALGPLVAPPSRTRADAPRAASAA